MKTTRYFALMLLIGGLYACEDCQIISSESTRHLEYRELFLNIGDPCDDGNPDTVNDIVDANCNCTGEPSNTCEGALLVMRAAG
ncbi:MAG: hypothetical protein R2795_20750 [Saprospiraceae bacterium]